MLFIDPTELLRTVQNRLSELGASSADRSVIVRRFEMERPYVNFRAWDVFSACADWTTAQLRVERSKGVKHGLTVREPALVAGRHGWR
jgi:hypothetical protein